MKHASLCTLASVVLLAAGSVSSGAILVDFGDSGEISATETYNTLTVTTKGANTSLEGSGEDFTGLLDSTGAATGVDLNVLATSTGGDIRGGSGSGSHDSVTGIDDNALNDRFWINNGTSAGNFGFTLTFTGLDNAPYDIVLTSTDDNQVDTDWSVATGSGDADVETITVVNASSDVLQWTNVTPDSGTLVLDGFADSTGDFSTTTVGFVSLTPVPEPGSLALVGMGVLCMLKRRRRP